MDLSRIKEHFTDAQTRRLRPPTDDELKQAVSIVKEDEKFQTFLANLNIDNLNLINFGDFVDVTVELKGIMDHIERKLNADSLFKGHLERVGSCVDGSKVDRVDEADTLFVLTNDVDAIFDAENKSFAIKNVKNPIDFVSDFADTVDSILQEMTLQGSHFNHGGYRGPEYSGVRYNGPAVTALFTNKTGNVLSLDITPVFKLPPEHLLECKLSKLLEPLQKRKVDRILDVNHIFVFPNTVSSQWQPTTALCEAKLLEGMSRDSPFKMAYCVIKLISSKLNKVNGLSIFPSLLEKDPVIETQITTMLGTSKKSQTGSTDARLIMRYGHSFLSKELADVYKETGKHPISINTTAIKYILLQQTIEHPNLIDASQDRDDVNKLVFQALKKFISLQKSVKHTLLDFNIDCTSVSKQSMLDDSAPLLKCILAEECKQILEKIRLPEINNSDLMKVDLGTSIVSSLKRYKNSSHEFPDVKYTYEVEVDVSITPSRDPRVLQVHQITNACMNTCGGRINLPILNHERIEEGTRTHWLDAMKDELKQMFSEGNPEINYSSKEDRFTIDVKAIVKPVSLKQMKATFEIMYNGNIAVQRDFDGEHGTPAASDTSVSGPNGGPSPELNQKEQDIDECPHEIRSEASNVNDDKLQQTLPTTSGVDQSELNQMSDANLDGKLKDVNALSWTKNANDWMGHLELTGNILEQHFECFLKTFDFGDPLIIYPSLSMMPPYMEEKVNRIAQRYSGHKGFLLWSRTLLSMFLPTEETPIPPAGHELDVLCVFGQDQLRLDLWTIGADRQNAQAYLVNTGRTVKYLMVQKLRNWSDANQTFNIDTDFTLAFHTYESDLQYNPMPSEAQDETQTRNKQLAALNSILLDGIRKTRQVSSLGVKAESNTLHTLSYVQCAAIITSRQYNYITGPPGSGKSLLSIYVCDQYGEDKTLFLSTTESYKRFIEYQRKTQVCLVQSDAHMRNLHKRHLSNIKCIIIDDIHNLECKEKTFMTFLEAIDKNNQHLYIFSDCKYQNYKHTQSSEVLDWLKAFCTKTGKRNCYNHKELNECHRNTRTIASYLGASAMEKIKCVHDIDGHDVAFQRVGNMSSKDNNNGVLMYVKSLQDKFDYNQIAVLVDSNKFLKSIRKILNAHLPNVMIIEATSFPRTGIVVDHLDNFMGLDADVIIFPILQKKKQSLIQRFRQRKPNIRDDDRFKTFIASRAVQHMAFLVEEDFAEDFTSAVHLDHIVGCRGLLRVSVVVEASVRVAGGSRDLLVVVAVDVCYVILRPWQLMSADITWWNRSSRCRRYISYP